MELGFAFGAVILCRRMTATRIIALTTSPRPVLWLTTTTKPKSNHADHDCVAASVATKLPSALETCESHEDVTKTASFQRLLTCLHRCDGPIPPRTTTVTSPGRRGGRAWDTIREGGGTGPADACKQTVKHNIQINKTQKQTKARTNKQVIHGWMDGWMDGCTWAHIHLHKSYGRPC